MSHTSFRFLRPRSRSWSGQRSKSCLSNNSKTTEANLTKLHRKIEHYDKVFHAHELGSYAKEQGSLAVFKVTASDQGHYKGPSGAFVTYCNISCFKCENCHSVDTPSIEYHVTVGCLHLSVLTEGRAYSPRFVRLSVHPSIHPSIYPSIHSSHFFPENISKSIEGNLMKLDTVIEAHEEDCRMQEP